MADGFSMNAKGFREIDQALADLGPIAGEKIMRSSMFVASKPMLERVQAGLSLIPGSGALRHATRRVYMKSGSTASGGIKASGTRFVMAVAPKTKDQVAIALANLKYKRKRKIRGIFWGHFVEWGHRVANRTSGRLKRSSNSAHIGFGRVEGRHIFRRAGEAAAPEVVSTFRKVLIQKIERALKRARKIK